MDLTEINNVDSIEELTELAVEFSNDRMRLLDENQMLKEKVEKLRFQKQRLMFELQYLRKTTGWTPSPLNDEE